MRLVSLSCLALAASNTWQITEVETSVSSGTPGTLIEPSVVQAACHQRACGPLLVVCAPAPVQQVLLNHCSARHKQ